MRHNVQKREVAALATKLQENSEKRLSELTDDRRLLVISHLPLAYAAAWRMRDCGIDLDDLRQEGCLGLCEAALRYDETANCSFAAYASHWCRKMIFMALNRYKRNAESLPDTPPRDDGEDADLLRMGQHHRISDALGCLTEKEQEVVRQYYGLETKRLSLTEIASQLGISKARATALHSRALHKLKAALMERPLVDYLAPWLE